MVLIKRKLALRDMPSQGFLECHSEEDLHNLPQPCHWMTSSGNFCDACRPTFRIKRACQTLHVLGSRFPCIFRCQAFFLKPFGISSSWNLRILMPAREASRQISFQMLEGRNRRNKQARAVNSQHTACQRTNQSPIPPPDRREQNSPRKSPQGIHSTCGSALFQQRSSSTSQYVSISFRSHQETSFKPHGLSLFPSSTVPLFTNLAEASSRSVVSSNITAIEKIHSPHSHPIIRTTLLDP